MVSLKKLVKNPLQAFSNSSKASPDFQPELFDRHVMTTYGRFPLALTRGAGCRVWDDKGNEYLDFVAGIATCTLGHAHPVMVEAVTQQIQTLHHVSNLYYIPEQGALAHWLTEHSCADRVFFCNSGAEANEAAIKLARKYGHTKLGIEEPVIITANASFHGRTLATITATGQPKYQKNFAPLVPGFHYVPFNDGDALESAIASLNSNGPRVAGILLEALQGEGGVNPGNVHYFQRVRDLCDRHQILLIMDEVQVGVGRTGKVWGYENLDIEPDVITVAKGLGGGVPIGAMLCKSSCDVLQPGDHASTYGGNPFVCGVALAVCQTVTSENLIANASARGQQLRQGLLKLVDTYPDTFEQVRGWGLINGLVIKPNVAVKSIDIVKAAIDQQLLLVPAGSNVIRFVPPLIVSEEDVEEALKKLSVAIENTLLER